MLINFFLKKNNLKKIYMIKVIIQIVLVKTSVILVKVLIINKIHIHIRRLKKVNWNY